MAEPVRIEHLPDGTEVVVYSDGTKRDRNGHFVELPPYANPITTSERGRELAQRRITGARQAAREGLAEGLGINLRTAGPGAEWREAWAIIARQFKQSENLRGMAETLNQMGRATGYLSANSEDENSDNAELAHALVGWLRRKISKADDTVDAEVSDDPDDDA